MIPSPPSPACNLDIPEVGLPDMISVQEGNVNKVDEAAVMQVPTDVVGILVCYLL